MSLVRMDHISVVVDDLSAAIAFFTELGLQAGDRMPISGPWVDRINALDNIHVEIVMMRTPDGHGQLELTKFTSPALVPPQPHPAPPNVLGLRSVMFEVNDIADTIARLRKHGGELIGEVVDYKDIYRLCYLRGPAGIIVSLAQDLTKSAPSAPAS